MLTPAQRFQFDTDGFVVAPDIIDPATLRGVIDRAREHGGATRIVDTPHFVQFAPFLEFDPAIAELASSDWMVGAMTDLVGGPVRLEECEAIWIRRPDQTPPHPYVGFHRGISPEVNCYARDGVNHYLWVKALLLLTDIADGDGGTAVVRGSHRHPAPVTDVAAHIAERPGIVAQAQGTAGSVLFMAESCVHSTRHVETDNTRRCLIFGYTPSWTQTWHGHDPSAEFMEGQRAEVRGLFSGAQRWHWPSVR